MSKLKFKGIALITLGILVGGAFVVALTKDLKQKSTKKEQVIAQNAVTQEVNDSTSQPKSSARKVKFSSFKPSSSQDGNENTSESEDTSKLNSVDSNQASGNSSELDSTQEVPNEQADDSTEKSDELVQNFFAAPSYTKVVEKFPSAEFIATIAQHNGNVEGSLTSLSMTNLDSCKVVQVISGDQFFCMLNNGIRQKFILYGIESPKVNESYGVEAKNTLHNFLVGRKVYFFPVAYDEYSRLSSLVYVNNVEINLAQVYRGNAFLNPYARLDERYEQAQVKAQDDYIGLWNKRNWIGGRPPINPFTERR